MCLYGSNKLRKKKVTDIMEIKHIAFSGEYQNWMRNIACLSRYWIQFFPIKHYDIRHILLYYCLCSLPLIFHMIYGDVGKNTQAQCTAQHHTHTLCVSRTGSFVRRIHMRLLWSSIDRVSASILWYEPYIKLYRFVPTVVHTHVRLDNTSSISLSLSVCVYSVSTLVHID